MKTSVKVLGYVIQYWGEERIEKISNPRLKIFSIFSVALWRKVRKTNKFQIQSKFGT